MSITTSTNKNTKTFFLFGSDAVRIYDEEGIDAVVEQYENNIITLTAFCFDNEEPNPMDLLASYNGYDGWTIITEEEFNLL